MTMLSPTVVRALAAASLAALCASGCTTIDEPDASPDASAAAATAQASASPSPVSQAFPDRPASTIAPWEQSGDFAVDATKGVQPVHWLGMEGKWDEYDLGMRIVSTPQARWIGAWAHDQRMERLAAQIARAAAEQDAIGLIAFQVTRDYTCERTLAEPELRDRYLERIDLVLSGLAEDDSSVWVVLESGLLPDLGACEGDPRGEWLEAATTRLADAGVTVYWDASGFAEPADAAAALAARDLTGVAGMALNVGGHRATGDVAAWGEDMLAALAQTTPAAADLGLIIDTSRNGVPLEGERCNDPDAGIGAPPRLVTDRGAVDALVWIKRPGESDGTCEGGLPVGQFELPRALALADNGVMEESW